MTEIIKSDCRLSQKKVFVKTYGCQMNVYDSERMLDTLGASGYSEVQTAADADLVILNTCHIREKAAEKVYSELGRLRKTKAERVKAGGDLVIAVAGCVAQAEGAEIVRREASVGIVVGPQSYHKLPALIAERGRTGKAVVETEFPALEKFERPAKPLPRSAPSAFLTVQEGCNKFCTFCVVPYTRGTEYSRPVGQVLDEARRLAGRGVKEITVLGQNVNAYRGLGPGGRPASLAALLWQLAGIPELLRLRYTTSHPNDMSGDLIDAHRSCEKLMPYLHLPAQSGSDRILKAMNRRHTAAGYLDAVENIRAARPDIALSTDIIVGFPGETLREFDETLKLVETVKFAQSFSFKYSPRAGTPAAENSEQICDDEKSARLAALQQLLNEQQAGFNAPFAGREADVLWESAGKIPGHMVGRSPYMQTVVAAGGSAQIGSVGRVKILDAGLGTLRGSIIS